MFDNDEFEVRSPENWLSLARDSDGNMAGLPARALFVLPDSTGQWRSSKVGKTRTSSKRHGLVHTCIHTGGVLLTGLGSSRLAKIFVGWVKLTAGCWLAGELICWQLDLTTGSELAGEIIEAKLFWSSFIKKHILEP